jgi:signal recognition particle receptor subunit alpha
VSSPVAEHLCNNVAKILVGKKISALESITKLVKDEISTSLSTILTPGSSTDLLTEIKESRNKKEPYVIVFIGVNGVGKSTNLSKICFWLLQNGLSVLIAACDTFRSGAVEQLQVHVRNLSSIEDAGRVALFNKGYGKDPAGIAKEAIGAGMFDLNQPKLRSLTFA